MDGEAFSCFSFDSPDCYGTKYATIVSWLRRAVEEVDKARASVATSLETENGFQAIFVAPEYMFAGENSGKRRQPMSVAEKNDVVRDINDISKTYAIS
jgi:hypothetical protein